jgi:hypothetical protein
MYTLSEQQIDFILNDIKTRGVEMEDLQLNLLDHICCIIERELQSDDDFQQFYQQIIPRFFNKELKEIEEEIILLLTFKNYFATKNVMINSGCISAFLLIVGSVFKVLHLPGAGISLVLGIAILSLLFLPLVFILKTRDDSTSRDKLVLGLGTLIGIFFSWATLFKVMHWPNGDGILWFLAIGTSAFLLIPLYFFTGIRDPNIRLNTVVTTIMLLGGTGLLFSLVNIQPSFKQSLLKMSSYAQSEDLLKKLQCRNTKSPNALTADINRTAEEIKGFVLENMIGQPSLPKDFKERNLVADDSNLGEGIDDPEKGKQLFSHLKEAVLKYNAHQGEVENKIPTELFQLEKMGSYSKYAFLNSIVQLQMYLATNENRKDCK